MSEIEQVLTPEVICGEKAHACVCGCTPGHDGPHECADKTHCDGSWTGSIEDNTFEVVRWPLIGRSPLVGLALRTSVFPNFGVTR